MDWRTLKESADRSLYVKAKEVLGYRDLRPQPHAEMCQFIQQIPFGEYNPAKFRMMLIPRDCFKALSLETLIPTPIGIKKLKDITIDDQVFDSEGNIVNVIGESNIEFPSICYRITFSTKESVIADGGHLWVTDTYEELPPIKTTIEILHTLYYKNKYNHFLKLSKKFNSGYRHITNIETTFPCPVKCLAVDSPTKTYLITEGYIPTHNSTLGTISYSLDLITKFPEISILISSEIHEKSISFLREIKGHIESNPKFRKLYGDLQSPLYWKEDSIVISTRRRPNKTPTILTTGVGGSKTMHHVDCIIIDDPHSEKNYRTTNMRKKVIDHVSALLPLLKPHGFMLIIGTRWHQSDAFAWIQDSFPQLKVLIKKWKNKGELYFPGKITENYINIQREILTKANNAKLFYAWYENEPVASEIIAIPYEWRKVERLVYVPQNWDYGWIYRNIGTPYEEKRFVKICGVVDPADSENMSADFTGVTIKGIDTDNKWWVFYGQRFKGKSFLMIRELVETANKFKVGTWGIETTGGRKLFRHDLQQIFLEKQMFCRVIELKSGNRAKSERIASLSSRFEVGTITIDSSQTDLIEELDYPETNNDDVIDSLAYHNLMEINPPTGELKEYLLDEDDEYSKHPLDRKKNKDMTNNGRDPVTGY